MAGRFLKRYLALDVGTKRIGVAVSDPLNMFAIGVDTIRRKPDDESIKAITSLCQSYNIEKLVVGLPVNMDGTQGFQARDVSSYADKIKSQTDIEIIFQDERLTSHEAQNILLEQNISPSKNKELVDKKAAELILQEYLESKQRKKRGNDE